MRAIRPTGARSRGRTRDVAALDRRVASVRSWSTAIEFLQLLARDLGRERQIFAVALNGVLSFPAQDVAQEFLHLRIDWLAPLALEIVVDISSKRIAPVLYVLEGELDIGATLSGGKGDGFCLRRQERNAGVGDAVTITAEIVHHQLAGAGQRSVCLLPGGVRIGAELLVPLSGSLEDLLVDLVREVILEVVAVDVDRLVGPFAGETELPPVADVPLRTARERRIPRQAVPAPIALGAEDAVELLERELRDRIFLVHEHTKREGPSADVERAGGHDDFDDIDIGASLRSAFRAFAFESLQLVPERLPSHGREIGDTGDQPWKRNRGARQVVLEADVRMILSKPALPDFDQRAVLDVVVSPLPDRAGHDLLRLVFGKAGKVELRLVEPAFRPRLVTGRPRLR